MPAAILFRGSSRGWRTHPLDPTTLLVARSRREPLVPKIARIHVILFALRGLCSNKSVPERWPRMSAAIEKRQHVLIRLSADRYHSDDGLETMISSTSVLESLKPEDSGATVTGSSAWVVGTSKSLKHPWDKACPRFNSHSMLAMRPCSNHGGRTATLVTCHWQT